MKNVWWVFAVTFLIAGAVFAQVHIGDTISIVPKHFVTSDVPSGVVSNSSGTLLIWPGHVWSALTPLSENASLSVLVNGTVKCQFNVFDNVTLTSYDHYYFPIWSYWGKTDSSLAIVVNKGDCITFDYNVGYDIPFTGNCSIDYSGCS